MVSLNKMNKYKDRKYIIYPTVILTSNNEDKEEIIGTITSYHFRADDITFKNAENETVWMQMTRKK